MVNYLSPNRILLGFIVVNLGVLFYSDPNSAFFGDALDYYEPALGILEHGDFVSRFRLPLYPLFLVPFLYLFDSPQNAIIVFQLGMLFLSSLVVGKIAQLFIPQNENVKNLVMALVVFNPVSLANAHILHPEILFLLLFSIFIFQLIIAYRILSLKNALISGMVLGTLCLIRNVFYIIYGLPFLFLFFGTLYGNFQRWPKLLGLSICSIITSIIIISPFLMYNIFYHGKFELIPTAYKHFAIQENLIRAEGLISKVPQTEARRIIFEKTQKYGNLDKKEWANLIHLGDVEGNMPATIERMRYVAENSLSILLSYSPVDFIAAMLKSMFIFFFSNGTGFWIKIFDLDIITMEEILLTKTSFGYNAVFHEFITNITSLVLISIVIGFLLIIRILNIRGTWILIRDRHWEYLGFLIFWAGYFTLIAAFIGYSRYRIPLDPLLFILAAYSFTSFSPRKKDKAENSPSTIRA